MPPRFIAQQLSHPKGLLGRVIGVLMNKHNAKMNAFAIEQLQLTSTDRVLEIGFGGGATLPTLLARAGFVGGLDRSRDMVEAARARFARNVAAGHADFREGTVEALPFEAAAFNKVCTVNTVYFWHSLDAGFAEIHRVLAPGGRVVVGFLPKQHMDRMQMPIDIFTTRASEDVTTAIARAGFSRVTIERPQPNTVWNVVVANR
ncbi:MAG TPA: class I SAM-dependent methyltransferase [Thermoanaerobaculia bacterium]